MAPTTRQAKRAFAEPPTDVLFDVFLLLSAKELCRLRVVCRAWRSLTCDPHFIRAHTAMHHQWDPLLVATFLSGPPEEQTMRIDLIDLSGKTVKRVASDIGPGQVLCPHLGLVFVANQAENTCRVLDPAATTDARAPEVPPRFRLPVLPAPSHRGPDTRRCLREAATSFAFGKVAATGEHKVLRIFHGLKDYHDRPQYLFEVLTLGGGHRRRGRARWRDMPSPDMFVCPHSSVVVDGVVYFLRNNAAYKGMAAAVLPVPGAAGIVVPPAADCVASFDLEREEWRKRLQGPISISMGYDYECDGTYADELLDLDHCTCQFALAELEGSLVLLHYVNMMTDLWLLTDFEKGVWVKERSIWPPAYSAVAACIRRPKPLFLLDDGKLAVRDQVGREVALYDPGTGAWTWVFRGPLPHGPLSIYAGSLLGLQDT